MLDLGYDIENTLFKLFSLVILTAYLKMMVVSNTSFFSFIFCINTAFPKKM